MHNAARATGIVLTVWHSSERLQLTNIKASLNFYAADFFGGAVGFHRCAMSILRRGRSLSLDLIIVGLMSISALTLRENFAVSEAQWAAFVPYLAVTLAIAAPTFVIFELDRSVWRFCGLADHVRAVLATVLIVAVASVVGFVVNRLDGIARSLPVLQIVLMAAGLIGCRVLTRIVHEQRRPNIGTPISLPAADDTVLVVGWSSLAELFVRSVAEFGNGKIHIAGILSPYVRHAGRLVQTIRVLGTPEDAGRIVADLEVHGVRVGRIVVATPFERLSSEARRVLREIESTTGIRLEFFGERLGICVAGVPPGARPADAPPLALVGDASALAMGEAESSRALSRPYWRVKRLVDAVVALTMIIVLSPLILLTAFIVALDVGLPTLFVQQRPGLRGYRFMLYKFRTMGPSHGPNGHRIPDEERISRVGHYLRRTRLDELPQLFNILIGDMSFVGPRPLVSREQSIDIVARLLVRPGLTGWAQVHGGRAVSVADKAALDLWYVRHASLKIDLKIIFATLPIVLFGERIDGEVVRLAWQDLHGLEGHGRLRD